MIRDFDIEVYDDLSAIQTQWLALQAHGVGYLFQSYEWCRIWYDTVGHKAGVRPHIITIGDGGTVQVILPLAVVVKGGLRRVRFFADEVSDYSGPIMAREFAVRLTSISASDLWDAILARSPGVDLVELKRMPETIDGIHNPFIDKGKAQNVENAYSAMLPATFEAFAAKRKKRLFHDSGRQRRRLDQMGSVEIKIAGSRGLSDRIVRAMVVQKGRRYIETVGESKFERRPELVEFYARIAALRNSILRGHASALCVGNEIVATHVGAVFQDRFYYIMPSYASGDWMRYSPGRILMEELIRGCISSGLRIFDMTVGDDAYKKDWTDTVLPLYRDVRALSWRGRIFVLVIELKQKTRAALKHIGWLRNFVRTNRYARSAKKLNGRNDVVRLDTDGTR